METNAAKAKAIAEAKEALDAALKAYLKICRDAKKVCDETTADAWEAYLEANRICAQARVDNAN